MKLGDEHFLTQKPGWTYIFSLYWPIGYTTWTKKDWAEVRGLTDSVYGSLNYEHIFIKGDKL